MFIWRFASFAAAVLVAGAALGQAADQARPTTQPRSAQQQAAATTQPTAFMLVVPVPVPIVTTAVPTTALAPDAEEIRDVVASATEAAMADDGFDDLLERFVDADRNRFGAGDTDFDTLDAVTERVRAAWRAKYGSDFDIHDEGLVYAPFPVIEGRLGTGAAVPAARPAINEPEDFNRDPGRALAVFSMASYGALPQVTVPLIREFPGRWKIDVPSSVTGEELRTNLLAQMNALLAARNAWPADEAQAYRVATHHVLAAVMGATAGGGGSPPPEPDAAATPAAGKQ